MTVSIQIKTCDNCPFLKRTKTLGSPSQTHCFCKKESTYWGFHRAIEVDIKWPFDTPKSIPKWCPLKDKDLK